jgi:hypothetical protein
MSRQELVPNRPRDGRRRDWDSPRDVAGKWGQQRTRVIAVPGTRWEDPGQTPGTDDEGRGA